MKLDPENIAALINLGGILAKQGRKGEALKYLKCATKTNPDIFEAWINLGTIYDDMNNLNEAMKCYDIAKNLNFGNAAVWYFSHISGRMKIRISVDLLLSLI